MRVRITRRGFLLGGAGAAVLSGAGLFQVVTASRHHSHVERALRRLFGPIAMDAADLTRFSDDFTALIAAKDMSLKKVRAVGAVEAVSLVPLAKQYGPGPVARGAEKFDRELVTAFLTSTTYLQVANAAVNPVFYTGITEVCASPFARFEVV